MTALAGFGYWQPDLPRQWLADWFPSVFNSRADLEQDRQRDQNGPAQPGSRRETVDRPVQTAALFASDVMMVIETDDFFQPQAARAIREIVADQLALPQVRGITWIENAPPLNLFGLPEPVLPDHRASLARFEQAKQKALANPMIAGQLLSRDGHTLLLLYDIDWFYVRSDADCTTKFVEQFDATMSRHREVRMTAGITGEMPMRLRIGEKNDENDRKFQWIVYGGVLLMAAILFRGLLAVIIAALPTVVGTFWTFGLIRFMDMEDNPFNFVVVPVLLSMVGFTDSVHLVTHIRAKRLSGLGLREATALAMDEVGGACFLTSLTTAIGFASLWWAHHDVVREFGQCCVVGVIVMFVAVITTISLACRTWLVRGIQKGEVGGWIERNFYRITPLTDWVGRWPRAVAGTAILLTVLTGMMTLQLKPDERVFQGIPESSPEAKTLRHMDQTFGGLETSFVEIRWTADEVIANAEVVAIGDEVESLLRSEPMLGSPLGIATLVRALPGDGTAIEKAGLIELLPPPLKQIFWSPSNRRAFIVFRVQDLGIAAYGEVFERLSRELNKLVEKYPGVTIELQGTAVWRWQNLYRIVVDLARSLGTASIVILVVLGIFYRSLRFGLIAVIPNLFPLTITGAAMWLVGQPLELVSVLAFTVCLGIAVDDTIHFMTRYREEIRHTSDRQLACKRATQSVGPAMTMTTVVLLAGFSTVWMSDSREHHVFALMGAATIAAAIIGDLVFLPALLQLFGRSKRQPPITQKISGG